MREAARAKRRAPTWTMWRSSSVDHHRDVVVMVFVTIDIVTQSTSPRGASRARAPTYSR